MTKHDPRVTLAQIEDAAEKVEALCAGKRFELFSKYWVAVMALERLFLIIGEAVKRLPEDLCDRYPEFPWRGLLALETAGTRSPNWNLPMTTFYAWMNRDLHGT